MQPVFAHDVVAQANLSRAVVVAAHPDDIDFGAAGTVAALTGAGVEVTYCLVTSGDAGGFELDHSREAMIARREQEQRDAAAVVGVGQVCYLKYLDGYVEPSHRLISDLVAVLREQQPDVVISQHPQRNWARLQSSHPDHLAVGEAMTHAVYPAVENPFAYPELEHLPAFRVRQLWMMGAPAGLVNRKVDVTDHVDDKLNALHKHNSQHPDPKAMDDRVRAALEANHGQPGRAAEVFHVVAVNDEHTFAGF